MFEGLLTGAVLISSVLSATSVCPHESGYRKWSNPGGWTGGKANSSFLSQYCAFWVVDTVLIMIFDN
ncbi:hypothetical protein DPMN_168236 [Dreissena polymorpha]|uniref:Uncharacterized protein n=1 Tax=Dreissena polymorpha TaxID=45954 RepID=A0A9D4IVR1_DREPO|nr:hypothetical protein DPMN_168236 [Dreissena polymorpha]